MRRELKTPPSTDPIDREQIKVFANIDDNFNDPRIDEEISDAVSTLEEYTGRAFVNQDWIIWYDSPEFLNRMDLSTLNVTAINSVTIYYRDNTSEAIDPSNYRLAQDKIVFNDDFCPSVYNLRSLDTIAIDVTAGYGSGPDDMPKDIQSAISTMVSYWLDVNSMAASTETFNEIPGNVHKKIKKYIKRTQWL